MPNIFEYTNFRKYLKDYFREQKAINPDFSHRYFVRKLGMTTSNYMLHIMNGVRNLPGNMSLRLTHFMGLNKKETYYFEAMVAYLQSKAKFERTEYFSRMAALNSKLKKKKR